MRIFPGVLVSLCVNLCVMYEEIIDLHSKISGIMFPETQEHMMMDKVENKAFRESGRKGPGMCTMNRASLRDCHNRTDIAHEFHHTMIIVMNVNAMISMISTITGKHLIAIFTPKIRWIRRLDGLSVNARI